MKIETVLIILFCYNLGMVITKIKKYKLELPKKIKIFNLGSSHGYFAFNYENIKNGANLAQISQTFYYDYVLLKNFYNRIDRGAICFVPISYFSFSNSRETWQKGDMINYYKILPLKNFKGKEKIICFIFRYLPIVWSFKKKRDKIKKNKIIKTEERILKQVSKIERGNTDISIKYLKKIIKKLKEKHVRIILITTPFQNEYNKYFDSVLLEKYFYSVINEIKNEEKIEYYDFSNRYDIFNSSDYFDDGDHLNKKGSKIFMKEIKKILNKEIKC